MQHKRLKLSVVFFLGLGLMGLQAQKSVNSTGGNASGSGGSASYSVGQAVYTSNTETDGTVAQGVQQPYEISIVTEIKEAKDISLSFLVYPNPTTDFLKLKTENYTSENLRYHLYQLDGKILETKKIESLDVSISMEHLASGIYFLKITELDKDIKTFKIIKN